MPRPIKGRNVCDLPRNASFGPLGQHSRQNGEIIMTVDEYESIRLIDEVGLTQEECAQQMSVARTTVQSIYARARKKLAHSLVNGVALTIRGGEYKLCGDRKEICDRYFCHRRGQRMHTSARFFEKSEEGNK